MKNILLVTAIVIGWLSVSYAQENPPNTNTNTNTTTTTTTTTTNDATVPAQQSEPASSSAGGKCYFGLEFLPTFTHFDVTQVDGGVFKTNFVLGYGFGGFVGVNLGDHAALQGEVLYSALSQKYTDQSNIQRRIDLNYINVPLLLVLNTNISKPVNLNIAAGPQLGLNVGSKVNDVGSGAGVDTVAAVVAVKTGDVGVAYGAGIDFGLGSTMKLSIGYRGVLGLVDISDKSQTLETNQYYILDKAHIATYAGYVALRF